LGRWGRDRGGELACPKKNTVPSRVGPGVGFKEGLAFCMGRHGNAAFCWATKGGKPFRNVKAGGNPNLIFQAPFCWPFNSNSYKPQGAEGG